MPSPYGPRLPWYFPFSRSFWLSGDVSEGPVVVPRLKGLFVAMLRKLRSPQQQPYEQVHNPLQHTESSSLSLRKQLRIVFSQV